MKPSIPLQTVTVIGLGYVGFPLAAALSSTTTTTRMTVYGLITSAEKAARINSKTYIPDIPDFNWSHKTILATTNPAQCLPHSEVIVVCVPTPATRRHNPDLRILIRVLKTIRKYLHPQQLVIIESTLGPGMMQTVCLPLLEKSRLRAGYDFDLSYCPERINPGDNADPLSRVPRIIASASPSGINRTARFYQHIIRAPLYPVASFAIAETAKMLENAFRDVNIALAHEFALFCSTSNIPIADVINAAATKPFGFMPFYPRTGVGGDCIPVDPWYQIAAGKKHGFAHALISTARTINDSYPRQILTLLQKTCRQHHIPLSRSVVGIYGMSYKSKTKSTANSPALTLAKLLEKFTTVQCYDKALPELSTVTDIQTLVKSSDIIVICTDNEQYINQIIPALKRSEHVRIIFDCSYTVRQKLTTRPDILIAGIGIPL